MERDRRSLFDFFEICGGALRERRAAVRQARQALRAHERRVGEKFRLSELQACSLGFLGYVLVMASAARYGEWANGERGMGFDAVKFAVALAAIALAAVSIFTRAVKTRRALRNMKLGDLRKLAQTEWSVEDARLQAKLQAAEEALQIARAAAGGARLDRSGRQTDCCASISQASDPEGVQGEPCRQNVLPTRTRASTARRL